MSDSQSNIPRIGHPRRQDDAMAQQHLISANELEDQVRGKDDLYDYLDAK